ncbi:NADP-dependent aldehyde dehydrogenase [Saccharopolyspora erythraea NRRL 2338]|uniref:Aldehyde dehydrogenase (NADP(+)) n=1 Tax=Saccharopolyspora erythraea TaxID=1836 RepID=A0ABP3MJC5_SACER|nr:aldehyde dehydrogenase (NADP(+)) [Saccharopolyspora erythraea]PFG95089.1 NADP-dependent aldehyde dehydrogenase [Saccharopolyspora erythraea NRRL 2338]QRK91767.1 aldehyde dehydrogenase (NADP(+)) [Saccharopolyspora erythraea]
MLTATDPIPDTTAADLEAVLQRAAGAAESFGALPPAERARLLGAVADALDAAGTELLPAAMAETNLSEARLTGELKRTTFQLRLFAEVLAEGSYLGATIDPADDGFALGPKPDLRRMLVPLGPVLVFAASNFPFAFSVPGGDTASALAAGCPVVVKAHPGHPRLSARVGEIISAALSEHGAPEGAFGVVFGFETGTAALRDPRVKAAAFTGSVPAGRALFDIAASRPTPIPFFGELGSLNPAFVTPAAVRARGAEIAKGFVTSYSGNAGQLCTKPGLLFLPADHGLEDALASQSREVGLHRMLSDRLHEGYCSRRAEVTGVPGVRVLAEGEVSDGTVPTLLTTDVQTLLANRETLLEEVFGPLSIVVTYRDEDEARQAAEAFEGNLTATLHAEEEDSEFGASLLNRLRDRAGRLLFNGWPTGVAVSPAMQHGGPYPATTDSRFTSVGTAAIERFLRPVTYQNVPQTLLPEALRDHNPWNVPRRVHG